jgi:hypothetical protein
MIYVRPDDDYLHTLSPDDWAIEWARANDAGDSLLPRTGADYLALWNRYPERIHRYRPTGFWVAYFQLPEGWGIPAEPLFEREQERIILTLATDDRFRRAFNAALSANGGVA